MTNLDSVLKNKDITLLTKVYIVKPTVFPTASCASSSPPREGVPELNLLLRRQIFPSLESLPLPTAAKKMQKVVLGIKRRVPGVQPRGRWFRCELKTRGELTHST